MKKLSFIVLLASLSTSTLAQENIREAYFHELRGMEDSAGVTHLFYRLYEKSFFQCNEENGGNTITPRSDHVKHFNTETQKDSVKFRDYFEPWCIDYYTGNNVLSYIFFDSNPKKWIVQEGFECFSGITHHNGSFFSLLYSCIIKQRPKKSIIKNSESGLILSPDQDSIYIDFSSDLTIPLSTSPENWPEIDENNHEGFGHFLDSAGVRWNLLGIHPAIDSVYFAKNAGGHLYRSTNYTRNFEFADSSGSHTKLAFDADSSVIYSLITVKEDSNYVRKLLVSDDFGAPESWSQLSVPESYSRFELIETDRMQTGYIFLADSNSIYFSIDYGGTFSKVFSSEDLITGLYKKPNSNILYVLTKEELLEVNVETNETTSLKKLPVSNEPEPTEIPKKITLIQNYPNPFNPSTVISYQLTGNSLVRLEVFDVTGRKVAVLVDGKPQIAGAHQVSFDAGELSSGVYFYRLQTGGQTLTKKMLLMK